LGGPPRADRPRLSKKSDSTQPAAHVGKHIIDAAVAGDAAFPR
jgi:hypothetical protein